MTWITGGNFLTSVIYCSAPLIFWAMAVVFAERVGIWFLGVEGIALAGALAGILGEIYLGAPIYGLFCAIGVGALLGWLMNLLLIRFPTDQTAIGIAFNTTMLGLTSFIYRLGGSTSAAMVEGLSGSIGGFSIYGILALIIVLGSWWYMFKTGAGLKLRSVGDGVAAAEAAGINVIRTRILVMILAGVLAALGGDALTQGWVKGYAENVTAGRGFIGMAAVYFGRWNPLLATLACLVFGIGMALAYRFQASSFSGSSSYLFSMIPYVLTLLAVAILGQAKSPADAGKPYLRK